MFPRGNSDGNVLRLEIKHPSLPSALDMVEAAAAKLVMQAVPHQRIDVLAR